MPKPSLRELWQRVGERDKGISQSLYDVVEALVEAVEPEHTCGECRWLYGHVTFCPLRQFWPSRKPNDRACMGSFVFKSLTKKPEDTDATIRKLHVERLDLRVERDGIDRRCSELEHQLAKANRRYDESRTAWARLEASLREQLAEAKAEIEGLKESKRWWKQRCDNERHEITRLQGITSAQGPRIKELVAEIKLLRHELFAAKAEIAELKDVPNRQRDTIHHLNERFSTLYAEFVESKEELASYTDSVNADADLGKMVRGMGDGTRLGKAGGTYWSCQHDSAGDIFSCYEPSTDPIMALRPIQRKEVGDGL